MKEGDIVWIKFKRFGIWEAVGILAKPLWLERLFRQDIRIVHNTADNSSTILNSKRVIAMEVLRVKK